MKAIQGRGGDHIPWSGWWWCMHVCKKLWKTCTLIHQRSWKSRHSLAHNSADMMLDRRSIDNGSSIEAWGNTRRRWRKRNKQRGKTRKVWRKKKENTRGRRSQDTNLRSNHDKHQKETQLESHRTDKNPRDTKVLNKNSLQQKFLLLFSSSPSHITLPLKPATPGSKSYSQPAL